MQKLISFIKLNNLQYNPNRDPEFYRRLPNEEFRLLVAMDGSGQVKARFETEGGTLCEQTVSLPGKFDCQFRFDTPGIRIGTLVLEKDGETYRQDFRLDVMAEAWVG